MMESLTDFEHLSPLDFHFITWALTAFNGFLAAALINLAVEDKHPWKFAGVLSTFAASLMITPEITPIASYLTGIVVIGISAWKWYQFEKGKLTFS